MLASILRRLMWFVPLFFLISCIAFGLSKLAPGDAVERINQGGFGIGDPTISPAAAALAYQQTAQRLQLDKPAFYFSITTASQSDTLYRILRKDRRANLHKLSAQYGNWKQVQAYYHALQSAEEDAYTLADSLKTKRNRYLSILSELYVEHENARIDNRIHRLQEGGILGSASQTIQENYQQLKATQRPYKQYIPAFHWHGFDNQYHRWIRDFLQGDFGISLYDFKPVSHKIKSALFWTLIINSIAILIAYLLAVYLGVLSARKKGSKLDKGINISLFLLYSLPSFWVATLLVVFFTTPEYGAWTDIFPSTGLGSLPKDAPFWSRFLETASHLILPIFCVTYASLAFIARQTRNGMLEVFPQLYIRTARAKGLPERKVIWKHAFRNALFPLITIFAAVLPASIAGSVIVEQIFNIPGMGRLMLDSILNQDWTVVYAILLLGAVLTMLGILIADLLYAWADPRVRLK